jgi:hypothetical protein
VATPSCCDEPWSVLFYLCCAWEETSMDGVHRSRKLKDLCSMADAKLMVGLLRTLIRRSTLGILG